MAKRKFPILMVLPPVIFLSLAAVFIIGLQRQDPDGLPSAFIGRLSPDLTVTALGDGPLVTDEALRSGDLKLVNFWASWCGPCRIEHPNLIELSNQGLPVYGLNYKDIEKNALGFLAELGDPYVASAQIEGRAALDWGVYGVPETFLLDGNGKILLRTAGPVTQRVIREKLMPAIEKARNQ